MSIRKYVQSIFADIENFPKEGLTQKDLQNRVLKQREQSFTERNLSNAQSSVSKALKKLIEDGHVTKSVHNTYHPVTKETAQQEALAEFAQNVYCIKSDIYAVVNTMYLIKVHGDYVYAAAEYLRKYLGPDRYFDIFFSNSYLWVLWESRLDDEEEFRTVYQEISEAVAISYSRYIDSLQKKHKLINK